MKRYNQFDRHINAAGLHCPQPIIRCKASLSNMKNGEVLEVVTTDKDSLRIIPALVTSLGDELIDVVTHDNQLHFFIRRNSSSCKGRVYSLKSRLMISLMKLIQVPGMSVAHEVS